MRILRSVSLLAGLSILGVVASCTDVPRPPYAGGDHALGGSAGSTFGGGFLVPLPSSRNGGATGTEPKASAFDSLGCAEATSTAEIENATLIFLLDRSASMVGESRWGAVRTAILEFIDTEQAKGSYAALSLFPSPDENAVCVPGTYAEPEAGLGTIPAVNRAFASALNTTKPDGGSTPMATALSGATTLAKRALSRYKRPTAIVLVTDGAPGGCAIDTFEETAKVAAEAAPWVPTYVIGVGTLETLDHIAAAGGTGRAVLVDPRNPTKAVESFQNQIARISTGAAACDLALPQPPEGSILHPELVNVEILRESGPLVLDQNTGCEGGEGWQYDDRKAPTRVRLCTSSCDLVQADPSAEVRVVFGCQTQLR